MSYFNNRSLALAILGVNEGYTLSQLKAAYLKKAKVFHPDTGGTHEEFLKLQQAYEYLSKETSPKNLLNDDLTNNPIKYTNQTYYYKDEKINKTSIIKNLTLQTLEIFVLYFSSSRYLLKATISQFIFFGFWLNDLLNLPTPSRTLSWVLQLSILSLYLLLVLTLLLILVSIFHKNIWYLSLKFKKINSKKLNKIRNISLLLYTITTLPGYIIYLALSLTLKIIKLLIKR